METLLDGIAPEHGPALIAGLIALVALAFVPSRASVADRWAGALLGYSAAVHVFLPLGGHGNAAAYLACGLGFGVLAFLAMTGRRWRLGTAVLAPATVVGYLIWGGSPDQVGILTALIELTAFGLAVTARRRVLGAIGTVTAVFVAGAAMWIGAFTAHQNADADAGAAGAVGGHHDDMARAQAGVIMRALGQERASAEQTAAAIGLVQATTAATARFARIDEALRAGYRYPLGKREGMDVHLEHPDHKKDGRLLDPDKPEMLVYAIEAGRATFLGVVYVMERAGQAGLAPGGPITRWHAHNLCVTLLPPGIGIVTPYGGCPPLSITITIAEMMHVWVVDPPGGPYAEGVDQAWARDYHRKNGISLL